MVVTKELERDKFLDAYVRRSDARNNDTHVEQMRRHIAGYRHTEWTNTKRMLSQAPHNIILAEGLEPHWVSPGKAIYWQEHFARRQVEDETPDGTTNKVVKDVSNGWVPTTSGLPANNPYQIAQYLNKGFRLRPPAAAEVVEASESTVPSEGNPAPQNIFYCHRHGNKRRGFISWKAYMRHAYAFKEQPEYNVPADLLKRVQRYPYYCFVHGSGYHSLRTVSRHYNQMTKDEQRKHPTIEQMKIKNNSKE